MELQNTYYYFSNSIDKFTNELVYGGYFVALSGPTYIFIASLLLNITVNLPLLMIAYLTPLIVYSFNYYNEILDDVKSNPERAAFLASKLKNYPVLIITYITLLFLLLVVYGNQALIAFIALLAILGILYTVLFKEMTKKIPLLKNIFVSLVWASGGAFFLLLYYSMKLDWFFILFFIFIFLQDIANVIFFDLKDVDNDKSKGLKTLPVMWGRNNTLKFLYILNFIALVPIIIGIFFNIFPLFTISLLLIYFYKLYYLSKAKSADNTHLRNLTYTLVEAEFIFLTVLLVIGMYVTNIIM